MGLPAGFEGLLAIMDRLREPGGCPWDREQDYSTLRGYLLEECYEVVEALDLGDAGALTEELGDLLFQIIFLSRIGKERGEFTIVDVIRGISEKMVRRHEHVFGSTKAETADEVVRRWEEIKRIEKPVPSRSALGRVPTTLPALLRAKRLGLAAARAGFDWKNKEEVLAKVDEELRELREAISNESPADVETEFGDLLFSLAMLARWVRIDPERALERANRKFRARFERVELALDQEGLRMEEAGGPDLERMWRLAKQEISERDLPESG